MNQKDTATSHPLCMGYICHWEIDERVPKVCQHCQAVIEESLPHYILSCPVLDSITPYFIVDLLFKILRALTLQQTVSG